MKYHIALALCLGLVASNFLRAQESAAPAAPQTPPATAAEVEAAKAAWTADFGAALKRAKAENKDLLVVFTGSDRFELCRLYDRDILFQPGFVNGIRDHFVPVRLDYPKQGSGSAAEQTRKALTMKAYRIAHFPTLVLADAGGRPYAINGYQPFTPAEYAKVVEAMRQTRVVRDDHFAKAAQAEGIERASHLAKAIPKLPGSLAARFYRKELEEIIALDPENETGKAPVARRLIADVDYADQMEKLKRDIEWSKMIELTDRYIEEQKLEGAAKQMALLNKVAVYRDQANTPELIRTLLEVVKVDENTEQGRKAQKVLDGMRARVLQEQLSPK